MTGFSNILQAVAQKWAAQFGARLQFKSGLQLTSPKSHVLPKNTVFFPQYGMRC